MKATVSGGSRGVHWFLRKPPFRSRKVAPWRPHRTCANSGWGSKAERMTCAHETRDIPTAKFRYNDGGERQEAINVDDYACCL